MLRSELLQQHSSEYRCIFWRVLSDGLTVIFNRAILSAPPPPFFPVRQPVQNVYPGALGADGEENGRDGQPPAAKQCRERWNWGRNRGRRGRRWGKQQSVTGKKKRKTNNSHFAAELERRPRTSAELLFCFLECVSGQMQASSSFESRVVVVCEKMMSRACWAKSKHLIHSKTFRGMTLLHLAAGQGYANLIQTLIKWR